MPKMAKRSSPWSTLDAKSPRPAESSTTVGCGGSELDHVVVVPVVVPVSNVSKFVIVEGAKGLDGSPVPTIGLVATHPVSNSRSR